MLCTSAMNSTSDSADARRDRSMRSATSATIRIRGRSDLAGGDGNQAGGVDRGLRPALPRLLRQLVHQLDRAGVVVAGTDFDPAVVLHPVHELAPDVGANDRERPVVERADATGGDVGVFG